MKVLHVIPSLLAAEGGLRSTVISLCAALGSAGIRCEVACIKAAEPVLPTGTPVHRFDAAPGPLYSSRPLRDWLTRRAADFDLLIAHSIWRSPTRYAVAAARQAGRPCIVFPHGMLDPDALAHHRWRKRLRWWTGERRAISDATLIFSNDEDRTRSLAGLRGRGAHALVVPNPVSDEFFAVKRRTHQGPARILCLNRLHPRKGVLVLVAALLRLRDEGIDFTALIAGPEENPAYAGSVRALAAPLTDGGRLEIRATLDLKQVLAELAAADLLVHPATGYENFGMVVAEAAAAGVPAVASRRALIVPGLERQGAVCGVEPTPTDLARAIGELIRAPELAARIAEEAGRAAQAFRIEAVGEKLAGIFDRLIASAR